MLKIKCDINQRDLKIGRRRFVKSDYFHSLEVVDRVSETQLDMSENSNWFFFYDAYVCMDFPSSNQISICIYLLI